MSKMSDLILEVEELFEQDYTNEQIAAMLGVPLSLVDDVFLNYLQRAMDEYGL